MASKMQDESEKAISEENGDGGGVNEGQMCCICCESMSIFAIGACDHPICYKCSARMRVLGKQTYCPSCRAEMKKVVISFQERKFADFTISAMKAKRTNGGFHFEEWRLSDAFNALFDNFCRECGVNEKPFKTFEELRTHMRREHEKQFCQICIDALSNFPSELKTYTKKEMVQHRKEGDGDDKSHRGHPECKFCNDRFFDNDTLLLHLRKSHFWCHFCEHDGKQEYYNVYIDLRAHFAEFHFLCDEGDCRNEKFTSVFREQIDYQAHKLAAHSKNFNKMQQKEARKIEVDYNYRRNQRQPINSVVTGADYDDIQYRDVRVYGGEGRSQGRGVDGHSQARGDGRSHGRDEGKHHGRGESRSRGGREGYRTMDFSNFEDVEKEREDVNEKRKQLKEKEQGNQTNKQKHPKQDMAAAAPPEIDWQPNFDNDDDVIGLPMHINKGDEDKSRNQVKPKQKEDRKNEKSKLAEKPNDMVNVEKVEAEKKLAPKPTPNPTTKPMEDYPSLPGAAPMHVMPIAPKDKSEEFPALGQSARPKDQKGAISHVAGIPVTVKKTKEKGKSWTQQSGRANLKTLDDFPSLGGNMGTTKTVPKQTSWQQQSKQSQAKEKPQQKQPPPPQRKPPGFDIKAESNVASNINGPSSSTGRGPPGLGASGTQHKAAPPGLPPGLPPTEKNASGPADPGEVNIRERNMRLFHLLQTYLDNFNLGIFKKSSGEFRNDVMSASQYYSVISELLGDNLKYVFSELVALLPDECESKRRELLKLNRESKIEAKGKENNVIPISAPKRAVWGAVGTTQPLKLASNTKSVKDDETWCSDCGQSFPRLEMMAHMESHGEAFPSLPTATKKKHRLPQPQGKKVHQSQIPNPWSK